jgi:hypothetical protein
MSSPNHNTSSSQHVPLQPFLPKLDDFVTPRTIPQAPHSVDNPASPPQPFAPHGLLVDIQEPADTDELEYLEATLATHHDPAEDDVGFTVRGNRGKRMAIDLGDISRPSEQVVW